MTGHRLDNFAIILKQGAHALMLLGFAQAEECIPTTLS